MRGYFLRLRRLRHSDGRYVFLAAMPKSGSTYLSNTLASLLGYEHAYFAFAYKNVEQELYVPRMVDAYGRGTVVQQHTRANDPNVELMTEFGIRPVVVVRNLFDLIVSVRDHLCQECLDFIPSLYPPGSFRQKCGKEQLDFVISYYGPWLISFYLSWVAAERRGAIDFLWLTYEDCISDWRGAIETVLDFHHLRVAEDEIDAALQRTLKHGSTRLNKGVAGRGDKMLTDAQKTRVMQLLDFHAEEDFSRLGIS